ncbi:MAG: ATP-binding protein [Bacteroidota bacterium]
MSEKLPVLHNAQFLMAEIDWLKQLIVARLKVWNPMFKEETRSEETDSEENLSHPLERIPAPSIGKEIGTYAGFIVDWQLIPEERVALILALTPHLAPQVLDIFFTSNASYNRSFSEFGGIKGRYHKGFLPSWETLYFILAGNDLSHRIQLEKHFHHVYPRLLTNAILERDSGYEDEPFAASPLRVTQRFLQLAVFENSDFIPSFSHKFPAELYMPDLGWKDLVLAEKTREAVVEIKNWITHQDAIFSHQKAQKMLQSGFRVLFYGPPGTGKSLTAGLIGKETQKLVFRVDLSKVISKYIGETEKNLAAIFDQAQHNDWILFFDEADALFGKRVQTSDAKDRYANQETAYLLQRIENFPGVVILASNLIDNLDHAFTRRFQSVIQFPTPGLHERQQLWKKIFEGFDFASPYETVEQRQGLWEELADDYILTGANIQNILRASLLAGEVAGEGKIYKEDIIRSTQRELEKENKL